MVNHAATSIVTRRLVTELLQPDTVAPYGASCRASCDEIVRSGRGYVQRWAQFDHWIRPGAPRLGGGLDLVHGCRATADSGGADPHEAALGPAGAV